MKVHAIAVASVLAAGGLSGQALATPSNLGPANGAILDLNGQANSHSWTKYTVDFTATSDFSFVTLAFRDDQGFLNLDDVSVAAIGGANLLVDGGFEAGVPGGSAPPGWTYDDASGASNGGAVQAAAKLNGSYGYQDGATQGYDSLSQSFSTTVGTTYTIGFWLKESSGVSPFSRLSTNGIVTGIGGNGVDALVYAGDASPETAAPEPATWAMLLVGFGGLGAVLRRRRRSRSQIFE